jgi:hypothetical protein
MEQIAYSFSHKTRLATYTAGRCCEHFLVPDLRPDLWRLNVREILLST